MTLAEFKKSGPWIRIGDIGRATRRFKAICGEPQGIERLKIARDTYAVEVTELYRIKRKQRVPEKEIGHFVMHLCTFLARWEDYYEERPEVLHDEPTLFSEVKLQEELSHTHRCVECEPRHDWQCRSPVCVFASEQLLCCPEWMARERTRLASSPAFAKKVSS